MKAQSKKSIMLLTRSKKHPSKSEKVYMGSDIHVCINKVEDPLIVIFCSIPLQV